MKARFICTQVFFVVTYFVACVYNLIVFNEYVFPYFIAVYFLQCLFLVWVFCQLFYYMKNFHNFEFNRHKKSLVAYFICSFLIQAVGMFYTSINYKYRLRLEKNPWVGILV